MNRTEIAEKLKDNIEKAKALYDKMEDQRLKMRDAITAMEKVLDAMK